MVMRRDTSGHEDRFRGRAEGGRDARPERHDPAHRHGERRPLGSGPPSRPALSSAPPTAAPPGATASPADRTTRTSRPCIPLRPRPCASPPSRRCSSPAPRRASCGPPTSAACTAPVMAARAGTGSRRSPKRRSTCGASRASAEPASSRSRRVAQLGRQQGVPATDVAIDSAQRRAARVAVRDEQAIEGVACPRQGQRLLHQR
jgi:hypothetical protein